MPGSARRRTAKPAGVLDQGLQPRLLPGGDGCCGTGHLIHQSQDKQRPQSAAHRCRLWPPGRLCARRAGLAPGAGRRGLIRRRAQVKPVVQPFSDTATGHSIRTPRRACGLPLMTSHWLVRRECRRSCHLTSPAGMCRWSTAQWQPLRIVVAREFRIMRCRTHPFAVVEQGATLGQPSWWSSVMVTSMYSWSPSASFHAALPRTGRFGPRMSVGSDGH